MTTAANVLNIARSKLGLAESPPGSNRNEITAWYGLVGAWCDMFVSYCLSFAGMPHRQAWVPNEVNAPAPGFVQVGVHDGQPGDLIIYNYGGVRYDHIGFIESVLSDGYVTIEGNWSDKVMRLNRRFGRDPIIAIMRPPYVGASAPAPATPGEEPADDNELRYGSRGDKVVFLQALLNAFGYGVGAEDGDFGRKTMNGVIAYQRDHGLVPDGVVGPLTWAQLGADMAAHGQPAPAPAPAPAVPAFLGTCRRGSRGEHVRQVQQRLADRGWSISVDGDFGPGTERVVKAFQAEKGLEVDGVVGPQTWIALWTAAVT